MTSELLKAVLSKYRDHPYFLGNAFTKPPIHPFVSLWMAFVSGCFIGSLVAAVFGANMPFILALFFSLLGGFVLTLVTMPVVWVCVRVGYAGPASAVLIVAATFFFVMKGPLDLFAGDAIWPGAIYVGAVVMCYLVIAYTRVVYKNDESELSRRLDADSSPSSNDGQK